ncbi:MAG: calcium-binding protein [Cyanobacteria bacterium P01_G01_bin.19]
MAENQIYGTENNDFLLDTAAQDEIFALNGNDRIETTEGDDIVHGDLGIDTLTFDHSSNIDDTPFFLQSYDAYSGEGYLEVGFPESSDYRSISFYSIEKFEFLTGAGNDLIDTNIYYSDDTVDAGVGNDYIFTGKGFDVVDGGYGLDLLDLDFSNNYTGVTSRLIDRHQGEYVSDESVVSFSNIEAVNVIGSQHDDVLLGFAVDSYWSDSEFFISPMVDGGMGYDELVLDYSDSHQDLDISVNFDFFSSTNSINVVDNSDFIKSLDFSNIEAFNVTTGRGDDDVDLGYDNYSDDTVDTGAGNDTIFTGKGFDLVDGGYGFDSLNLDFTTSIDGVTSRLYADGGGVYTSSDSLTEFSNIEAIALTGSPKDDLLFGLEGQDNIFGDLGADTIIGGKGTDYLDGGMGNDSIKGGDDDDLLFGGAGTDTIRGESGNDSIYGNEDRDLLFGYENEDTLHGGLGDDLLKGGDGDDLLFGGEGKDVLFGDAGIDIFALESDSSFDIVKDFSDGIDLFGLTNGLNFADLNIVNNSAGSAAVIKNASDNNRVIAFVTGVDAVDITSADFINI